MVRRGDRPPRMPSAVGALFNDKSANTAGFIAASIDSLIHCKGDVEYSDAADKMGQS